MHECNSAQSMCNPTERERQKAKRARTKEAKERQNKSECARERKNERGDGLNASDQLTAASLSVASTTTSSSARNFVLATDQFLKKSTCEGLQLSMTIRLCGHTDHKMAKRPASSRLSWSPQRDLAALAAAVAAAVGHGHQSTPMTFSAALNCSDLPALIHRSKVP